MASKSFIPSLSTLRGQDPSPQRVQDNVATALAGFRNGIADGVLATGVLVPVAGGTIRNPLGRQAQGVIVVASNAPCWIALDSSTPTTAQNVPLPLPQDRSSAAWHFGQRQE